MLPEAAEDVCRPYVAVRVALSVERLQRLCRLHQRLHRSTRTSLPRTSTAEAGRTTCGYRDDGLDRRGRSGSVGPMLQ